MKIVYILKSMAPIGGLERVICDKMNFLVSHRHEVILVTYEQGNHPFAFQVDSRIIHYDLDVRFFMLCRYPIWERLFYFLKFRLIFKKRLQNIVDILNPDIIIANSYSMGVADIITGIRTKAHRILESHVAFYIMQKTNYYNHNRLLHYMARFYDWRIGKAVRKFERVVTLTRGDACEWNNLTDKIDVIPNPITCYPDVLENRTCNYSRIICAGRLNSQKGFDLLIKAFALIESKCPQWHIDIFGNGDDETMLSKMILAYNLQKRIIIHRPSSDIYKEYQTSDFLVLSSRYEGFALVLAEAASCAIPSVAFRCKYGPEDIISDGENGLLVTDGNINELAEKILWMIEHQEARLRMGINARNMAKRYQIDIVMKQWEELFDSLK